MGFCCADTEPIRNSGFGARQLGALQEISASGVRHRKPPQLAWECVRVGLSRQNLAVYGQLEISIQATVSDRRQCSPRGDRRDMRQVTQQSTGKVILQEAQQGTLSSSLR
jgi:hypothetical protein